MEDKEKFTPGPWEPESKCVKGGSFFRYAFQVLAPSLKNRICYCETVNEANIEVLDANAALIAAAPEMYAELQDLLDAMEAGLFPQAAPGVDYPAVMKKKLELRKLLKKARGEE